MKNTSTNTTFHTTLTLEGKKVQFSSWEVRVKRYLLSKDHKQLLLCIESPQKCNTCSTNIPQLPFPATNSLADYEHDIPGPTPHLALCALDGCYPTLIHTAWLRKLNGTGGLSAARSCRPLKSMVSLASRGGVPVFSLPTANPSFSSVWASPMAGWSPSRPAGCISSPMWIIPLRNVPVVRITLPACTVLPLPETASFHRCTCFSINKALGFWCFCL